MKTLKEIDRYIGNKIHHLRVQKEVTLKELADVFGISTQQVQKYEKGVNRISAGNLVLLAKALGVDTNYFHEGYDLDNLKVKVKDDNDKEFIEMSNKFVRIKNTEHRNAVNIIIEALSKAEVA